MNPLPSILDLTPPLDRHCNPNSYEQLTQMTSNFNPVNELTLQFQPKYLLYGVELDDYSALQK